MKAAENVDLYRTAGDTDELSVICTYEDDAGTIIVADDATVEMHVQSSDVITIAGTAKGDASGTYLFEPTDILDLVGHYKYEVQIDDGDDIFTVARGKIVAKPEIA
jgi:hypothetical protein